MSTRGTFFLALFLVGVLARKRVHVQIGEVEVIDWNPDDVDVDELVD